ncbi:MAG: 30S ribosomal protein S6 [Desulfarculaceae bacterium]|jgi:small subunit ribosomal protein S6
MRHYETLFIISPDLPEEDTTGVMDKFTGILSEAGANVAKVDNWGRRRLAYEVKKFTKGYYVLFEYGATPEAVAEMERNFKIDENVIRYLTVKISDHFDAEAAAARAAAEEKKHGDLQDEDTPSFEEEDESEDLEDQSPESEDEEQAAPEPEPEEKPEDGHGSV